MSQATFDPAAAQPGAHAQVPIFSQDGHRPRPAGLAPAADRLQPRVEQRARAGARVLPVGRRAVPAREHLHRAARSPRSMSFFVWTTFGLLSRRDPADRRRLHDQLARAAALARARRQHRLVHGRPVRRADLRLLHGDVRALAGARRDRRRHRLGHASPSGAPTSRPTTRRSCSSPRSPSIALMSVLAYLGTRLVLKVCTWLVLIAAAGFFIDLLILLFTSHDSFVRHVDDVAGQGAYDEDRRRRRPEPVSEQGRLLHAQHDRRRLLRAHDHDLRLLGRVPVGRVQGRRPAQAPADGDVDRRHRQRRDPADRDRDLHEHGRLRLLRLGLQRQLRGAGVERDRQRRLRVLLEPGREQRRCW